MALCLALQWSPGRAVAWRLSPYSSITTLPRIGSPTLPLQAGEGKQRLDAPASENSAFESLVPPVGRARSHEEETLSLCFHPHAAVVLLGCTLSSTLFRTLAFSCSPASTRRLLVSPETEPFPRPGNGVAKISGSSSSKKLAQLRAWVNILAHALPSSLPSLHPDSSTRLHLSSILAPSPQHSSPPQTSPSCVHIFPRPAMYGMAVSSVPI